MLNFEWYKHPFHTHACKGGEEGCNGKFYKGGEFEPFYVPRPVMPQVDWADLTALVEFIAFNGGEVVDGTADPHEVKFHQRVEMDRLINMPQEVLDKPVLISQDMFLLDGNHRAKKRQMLNLPIPYIMIRKPFEEAMALLYAFPGTYEYGDGNEHKVTN